MKVLKFGGTSVGSVERIKSVARLIGGEEPKMVVFSAMAGTTDALVEIVNFLYSGDIVNAENAINALENKYIEIPQNLCRSAKSVENAEKYIQDTFSLLRKMKMVPRFSEREEKIILAQGELILTQLIHFYLTDIGVNAVWLPALDFMRTGKNGEPDIRFIRKNLRRIIALYPDIRLFITQGYICRDAAGEIDNLHRGGSDYSASLIGAALEASEIQIWTDIDGLHNNDPRVVASTYPVRRLTFDEAAKLAHFGAKILHPDCILPAKLKNIPVRLLNTLQPQASGTLISNSSGNERIKAVSAKEGVTYIRVCSTHKIPSFQFLNRVFQIFARWRTPIDLVGSSDGELSLSIDNSNYLSQIVPLLERFAEVTVEKDMVIVCVVGELKKHHLEIESQIVRALKGIPVKMMACGGNSDLSFVLARNEKKRALEALNTIFHH